jgi:iron complex transport system permease protein
VTLAQRPDQAGGGAPLPAAARAPTARPRNRDLAAFIPLVLIALGLLVVGAAWSLSVGSRTISIQAILSALFAADNSSTSALVRDIRLPRVVLAVAVGANIAVAGVVMQGITGNPLGAPDILGVSAGAALVVVVAVVLFTQVAGIALVLLAFLGAGVAAVLVLGIAGAGQGRISAVRLALAGVTVTAVLLSLTQAIIIFHQTGTAGVFYWLAGGVNLAQWSDVVSLAPWTVIGLLVAIGLAAQLNLLALGDDVALALGAHVNRTRLVGAAIVVMLAGASVAVSGPIAFIGLIVPHMTRRLVGNNHWVVIPLSGLVGATLLLYADIVSRYVSPPFETPTGIITALIGAPFFLYLARSQKVART